MTLVLDEIAVVALVETAYDGRLTEEEWPRAILSGLHRAAPGSRGGGWFQFTSSRVEGGLRMDGMYDPVAIGEVSFDGAIAGLKTLPPQILEGGFGRTQGDTFSKATGLGVALPLFPDWQRTWPGVKDSLGIVVCDPNGSGAVACVGLPAVTVMGEREQKTFYRVAVHLGAALRLRRRHVTGDRADAVLSPDGKVLHATSEGQSKREAIDESYERREYARKNSHDAEAGLEVWLGLSTGRWSLVDHWDTDGKRFVLAMRNAPKVRPCGSLTARERRIVALAAMGHGDKQIAYMLGLSMATVARALVISRKKMGVQTRVELIAAWRSAEISGEEPATAER